MKNQKFFVVALCLCIGIFGNAYGSEEDLSDNSSRILIFSFSHGPETETKQAQGILKISVNAFDPVERIAINNQAVEFQRDTKVDVSYAYRLDPGLNEFLVFVRTEKGRSQKKFIIHFGKKPKLKKPAFQFIGIAGYTNLDNVTAAGDGGEKQSGSKASLTMVPTYRLTSGRYSEWKLKGILLREKFSEKDFASREISYTKVALGWNNKKTFFGEIRAEVGVNDIRTNNDNPLLGEYESVFEYYMSGKIVNKISRAYKWDGKLEYKIKDSKAIVTDPDIDADAAVARLDGRFHLKAGGVKGVGKLGYQMDDAKGKYKDSSKIKIGIKVSYPFENYTPGLSYDYKQTTMKIANPLYGNIKPEDTMSVITLKLGYQIFKAGKVAFRLKNKQQTSNVETSKYSANETALSYTHIF